MALRLGTQASCLRSANLPSATAYTIAGWFRRRGAGGASAELLAYHINSGASQGHGIYCALGGTAQFYVGSGGTPATTGVAVTTDQWYYVAMSCAGTGATDLKLRHATPGATSFTSATAQGTTYTPAEMGFGSSISTYWANVALAGFKVYDRVLTDAELLAEMNRLTPASTTNLNAWWPMVADVAATADNDYSGNGRDLTLSGTITVEDGPPVGWGAPVLFVNAAASASVAITPGAGSLALIGYAPSANRTAHQSVTPGAGAVVLAGAAPVVSVSSASVTTPGSGALTLTGSAPDVALTAHKWLTPDAGAVALAGSAPVVGLTANRWLTPDAGAVALAGAAPTVAVTQSSVISPDAGAVTLAGSAPSVAQTTHQWLTPDAGAVVLTGAAPEVAVTQSGVISPAAGGLTLTGYAPTVTVTQSVVISPAAGALTLTGFAPTLAATGNVAITPAAGAVALAGAAPVVARTAHRWLTPGAGAVVIGGAAPSVSVSAHRSIVPDAGALTLTGYAPNFAFTSPVIVPANAEIVITGYAPNVIAIRRDRGGAGRSKRRRVIIGERIYNVLERDIPALLEAELLDRAPPVTAEVIEGPKPPRKRAKKATQPVKTVEQVRETVQQIKARIEPDDAWLAQALEAVAFRVLERLQDEEDSLMLLLAA